MEGRFAGVRLLAPPLADGEYVDLGDGTVVHLHDYARLYAVPGLYEYIVQERLGCRSPQVAAASFLRALSLARCDPGAVTVLDLGAGTGLVGALIQTGAVGAVVGVDALAAAREACLRDRPGVYSDYLVGDLARPAARFLDRLRAHRPRGFVSAGALGGTHAPPAALVNALALLPAGVPAVFTIDERWMAADERDGFGGVVARLIADGALELLERSRFQHRVSTGGEPIHYELVVAITSGRAGARG